MSTDLELRTRRAPPMGGLDPFIVIGDFLEPDLHGGDVVLAHPVERYCGEGMYVVQFNGMEETVYRVSPDPSGDLRVYGDARRYGEGYVVPRDMFNTAVIGRVHWTCHRIAGPSVFEAVHAAREGRAA